MVLKTPAKAKDPSKFTPDTGVVDLRDGGIHFVPPPQAKDASENAVPDLVNGEVCMVDDLLDFNRLSVHVQDNPLDSPEKKGAARAKKLVDPEKAAEKAAKVRTLGFTLLYPVDASHGSSRRKNGRRRK